MKSSLTRNTLVLTPSGLVPLAKLKPGDAVIGMQDAAPCIDAIVSVDASTVDAIAYELRVNKDVALVGGDQALDKNTVANAGIGHIVSVLSNGESLVKSSIQGKHIKQYDDIMFSVRTEHGYIFIGKEGSILVETD